MKTTNEINKKTGKVLRRKLLKNCKNSKHWTQTLLVSFNYPLMLLCEVYAHVRNHWNRDLSNDNCDMWPECPRKDWQSKSSWLHPRESGPEVDHESGIVITSSPCLVPFGCGAGRNYRGCWNPWGTSGPPSLGYCLRDPHQRKSGSENE